MLAWFVPRSQGFPRHFPALTAQALRDGVCGGGTSFTLALGTLGLCLLPPDTHPCC